MVRDETVRQIVSGDTNTDEHKEKARQDIAFNPPPKGDKQLVKAVRRGGKGRSKEASKEKGQEREKVVLKIEEKK